MRRRAILAGAPALAAAAALPTKATAEQRIEAAIEEIKAAFAELYPGWRPQVTNTAQRCLRSGPDGQLAEAEMNRHAVLIFAADESRYPQEARWFVEY